jgi:hypothetical protein
MRQLRRNAGLAILCAGLMTLTAACGDGSSASGSRTYAKSKCTATFELKRKEQHYLAGTADTKCSEQQDSQNIALSLERKDDKTGDWKTVEPKKTDTRNNRHKTNSLTRWYNCGTAFRDYRLHLEIAGTDHEGDPYVISIDSTPVQCPEPEKIRN